MNLSRLRALVGLACIFVAHSLSHAAVVWANNSYRQDVTAVGSVSADQATLTLTSVTLGAAETSPDGGSSWHSYPDNVFSATLNYRAVVVGGSSAGTVASEGGISQGQIASVGWPNLFPDATGLQWTLFLGAWGADSPYKAILWTSSGGGTGSPTLPQRKLSWTVANSNPPPTSADKLQTWAVFQFDGTQPTGIAFQSRILEAGATATLTIYVASDDPYNYRPGRVDYRASNATYGGFPSVGMAYGYNADGTINYSDLLFKYLEGVVPAQDSLGVTGNWATGEQVTSIPSGTTGPGVDNTTPVINTPAQTGGAPVIVTPGQGGTTTSTDSGTASAVQQGSNAIIAAVNTTANATRQAIDRNTAALNSLVSATRSAQQNDQTEKDALAANLNEGAVGAAMAQRDALLAGKDSQASSLFSSVSGGMTADKVTPTIASGDGSKWEIDLDWLGKVDINPFTNPWVQENLPFLNWLVAFFRVGIVWSAQVNFYRWLVNLIRENAITFMLVPSPPPTVVETIASSTPATSIWGKIGAAISSLFLATLILSSLSTILSVATTWGTIYDLVTSIRDGTQFISSVAHGLGATGGAVGRIVYLVNQYIPLTALFGIATNYIVVETGLVTTMPVLVFAMRIRRW